MQYDREITISTAGNRRALRWQPQTLWWSDFVQRLATAPRGQESLVEYLRLPKSQQDDLKDVGGFVGGILAEGRRKGSAVQGRDLVTLDLDAIPAMATDSVLKKLEALGCGYAVYSTRKHEPARPRLRAIFPMARTVTADEYEPIARMLGRMVGIELCDPTTFQAVRMMYWPSCCADGRHVYHFADRQLLDPDGILAAYTDWRDATQWPQVPNAQVVAQRLLKKQEDPTTKPGVVGAFCRVYNVYQAMEAFLPCVYEPVDAGDGRYTFTGGSTTGGAVVYDDGLFLYSHHATDPCSGQLVNAFDMVRLHLYGMLDDSDGVKEGTPTSRLPSFLAMRELATKDPSVSLTMSEERLNQTREEFEGLPVEQDTNWLLQLEKNPSTARYEKTVNNLILILRNDPLLAGKIAFDEFSIKFCVLGELPWNRAKDRRKWVDADDEALFWYIEHRYKINTEKGLKKAIGIVGRERTFNDLHTYIDGLAWDGVPRLDTLFIDYLNAEDTPYTRAVTRKIFCAAIARAMTAGVKFDYTLILVGKQGKGKSTLLRFMGKRWFLEDMPAMLDDKATERIQGHWLVEMGELNSLSRTEINVTKAFLSRTTDVYRIPYDKHPLELPRRCVIFGSTNDDEFLRDTTGNRRFWPVTLLDDPGHQSVFTDLPAQVDQIWAEAKARWQFGEPLFLSVDQEAQAAKKQEQYRVGNAKAGVIEAFLERPLPTDWNKKSISTRRLYWSGEFQQAAAVETEQRRYVCAAEIWCECFGQDKGRMRQTDTREINGILKELGWVSIGVRRDTLYGPQRSFERGIRVADSG